MFQFFSVYSYILMTSVTVRADPGLESRHQAVPFKPPVGPRFPGWNQPEINQNIGIKQKNNGTMIDQLFVDRFQVDFWLESTENEPKYKNKAKK